MSTIKRGIRNLRFGEVIRSALLVNEHLMFQSVMSCSTDLGKFWCGAIVGVTNQRFLVEWQRTKGKNISVPLEQIVSWKITNDAGGLTGMLCKVIPVKVICVDICINEQLTIRVSGDYSMMEIFVNHMKKYCFEKQL